MLLNKQLYLLSLIMECCSNVSPASEECCSMNWILVITHKLLFRMRKCYWFAALFWFLAANFSHLSGKQGQWTTSFHSLLTSWRHCFQTGWLAHSRMKVGVRETIKFFNLHNIFPIFSYISPKIFLYFSYIWSFRIPIFLFFPKKDHWAPCD